MKAVQHELSQINIRNLVEIIFKSNTVKMTQLPEHRGLAGVVEASAIVTA